MIIKQAEHTGFCFGVKRAVEAARSSLASCRLYNPNISVYTYGELIHNKQVVGELNREGIVAVDSLSGLEAGSTIIIRSHGVAAEVYEECERLSLKLVDATCPYVAKIHQIVRKAHAQGKKIFIAGKKTHPEVIGINGNCEYSAVVLEDPSDTENILINTAGILVAQTTFNAHSFAEIIENVKNKCNDITVYNTICKTSEARQQEAEKLSRECDIMYVVGNRHSSNTCQLATISQKNCPFTQIIEKPNEISLAKFTNNGIIVGVVAGASTPDSIFMEVINRMNELDKANVDCCEAETNETTVNETVVATEAADAAQTIEENAVFNEEAIAKTLVRIRNGQVLTGTVIQVIDGEVSVSIGYKSDGYIPRNEFSINPDLDPATAVSEGDSIEVEVLKVNDGEGNVLLSHKSVEVQKIWEKFLLDAESEGKVLEGIGKEIVKGGLIALVNGAKAFIPASQISTKYVANLNGFIGQPIKFKVIEVDAKRKRIVGSRKAVLLQEAEEAKRAAWEKFEVGAKIKGHVRRITDFGAFVDIGGGVDGLIHITDAAWGKVKAPSEIFKQGQEVETVILNIDAAKQRISLGYKQLQPKPWASAGERYIAGTIVEGKVVRIVPFGAFVSLEPTIDGLIHISHIGVRRVVNVTDEVNVGDIVRCKIIEIDVPQKRISLSRRDAILEENPDIAEELAKEKADRERERRERIEKKHQEEQQAKQQPKQQTSSREERRRERSEPRPERSERRRREPGDEYQLPPVETSTTSLAALLGGFIVSEAVKTEETNEEKAEPVATVEAEAVNEEPVANQDAPTEEPAE